MPTVDWNKGLWDGSFNWDQLGEQWSLAWGGSEAQWFGSLFPRIHRFIPCRRVLEIAPGYGRWTKFLLGMCESYIGIDLSEKCIQYCQATFPNGEFILNDGLSLKKIKNNSIDFCFSFDSLVHAELDVFDNYIPQILSKLTKDGVAFIHHSNIAACDGVRQSEHNRALSVSSQKVADIIKMHGGSVLIQENIKWGRVSDLTDGFTLFARNDSQWRMQSSAIENNRFMEEASIIKDVFSFYSKISSTKSDI